MCFYHQQYQQNSHQRGLIGGNATTNTPPSMQSAPLPLIITGQRRPTLRTPQRVPPPYTSSLPPPVDVIDLCYDGEDNDNGGDDVVLNDVDFDKVKEPSGLQSISYGIDQGPYISVT